MSISIALHTLAAVIWVGGMFFAYMALRPAAASTLEPAQRLTLWVASFKLFFLWVWLSVIVLLATGYWMVFAIFDGFGNRLHIDIMHGIGILMVLIYMHVFFAPYRKLRHAVIAQDFPAGAAQLAKIRVLVAINLSLGLALIAIASSGRYW